MTTTDTPGPSTDERSLDADKLMAFVLRAVEDAGATLNTALVVMGDRLGYYRLMADGAPTTPARLAERSATGEPYVREWLNAQAAGGYVTYDPRAGTYTLPPEQAAAFTVEDSPAYLPGLFQLAHGALLDAPRVVEAARAGDGLGWHEHNDDVHTGCERFFRPGYHAHLVESWLPSLDGVTRKLASGARVADVGCGHGASTVLLATAFPASRFHGSDYHTGSIEVARRRAAEAGVQDRAIFEVAPATGFTGGPFDLVTTFDALHDMGDPIGAARHVLEYLADEGTWMIVEPTAGDRVEDNLHPVGRLSYGFSTLLCTPNSLAQDVGLALGAQAGPARMRDVVTSAGFTRFRVAAQTPFNTVLEVRK